jgi:hypothetical protein
MDNIPTLIKYKKSNNINNRKEQQQKQHQQQITLFPSKEIESYNFKHLQ